MKLLDANVLLYAYDASSPLNEEASSWFSRILSGTETVAFSWLVIIAFLRLSTQASVFVDPLTIDEALDLVDAWLDQPNAMIIHPTQRHSEVLRGLLAPFGSAGNLTSDAHLAALAIEHGAELCSCDRDFGRFPGVRWRDPLSV